jgi:hypothetical protein
MGVEFGAKILRSRNDCINNAIALFVVVVVAKSEVQYLSSAKTGVTAFYGAFLLRKERRKVRV